jgi:hypothetical protein
MREKYFSSRLIIAYILAYISIGLGSIYFFSVQTSVKLICTVLYIFFFVKYQKRLDIYFIVISFCFVMILISQSILFGGVGFHNYITFILYYLLPPYVLLKIFKENTFKYLVDILYTYAIISLIFWGLSNVSSLFYDFTSTLASQLGTDPMDGSNEQFILYSYEKDIVYGIIRNPGPTNEPGHFGLLLMWGLVMNLIRARGFIDRKSIIFIITLITTLSTTVYVSLFVLALYYVFDGRLNIKFKMFFVCILLLSFYKVFFSLDFMQNKIQTEFEKQLEAGVDAPTDGRFLGAMKSIYVIKKYPITGRGLIAGTAANDPYSNEDASYGFLATAASMGIVTFTLYLVYFWRGLSRIVEINNFSKKFVLFAFMSLFINLFSQGYSLIPIFLLIPFTTLVIRRRKNIISVQST